MINETRIVNMLFSTALAAIFCLCSCTEKQPTTAPEPENLPVGFRPMSQAVWVKSGTSNTTTDEPLFPYDNFGVWGIARQGSLVYNLWGNDGLTEVVDPEQRIANNITNSTTPRVFTPTVDAYWLRGYTYNFLAIAPLNPSGLTNVGFTLADDAGNTTGKDYMTFTYDMSTKYTGIPATDTTPAVDPDYDFDLLGAAVEHEITTGGYSASQPLMFWHLFSKININVIFVNAEGTTINTGTVSQMRLLNIDTEADYTISFNNNNELAVRCQSNSNQQANLTFSSGTGIVNILPQNISDFEMYIDFTINEGTAASPKIVSYNDFIINLNIQNPTTNPNGTNPPVYNSNDSYSWNIKIGPKQKVSFKVEVAPWTSSAIQDAENNNEFEIN